MIEGWADNLNQNKYISALKFGSEQAFKVVQAISAQSIKPEKKARSKNKQQKEVEPLVETGESSDIKKFNLIQNKFQELGNAKLYDILTNKKHDKQSRDDAITQVKNLVLNSLLKNELKSETSSAFSYNSLSELFTKYVKTIIRTSKTIKE